MKPSFRRVSQIPMLKIDARAHFTAVAGLEDDEIQLDRAALLIAAETDDAIDVERYLQHLDELAQRFDEAPANGSNLGVSIQRLSAFIHSDEGFSGNVKDYNNPANSYLNRVIDTRCGIPITLAMIHIGIGQRLDLPVSGINFPGHFLVQYGNDRNLYVDPFSGRILSEADCATLFRQIVGPRARIEPGHLAPAPNKTILFRMLDNLKRIFWPNKQWDEAKACIERQLLLYPGPELSIQLGSVAEMQGNRELAEYTYAQILQNSDNEQIREIASKRLLSMASSNKMH